MFRPFRMKWNGIDNLALHCSREQWRREAEEEGRREGRGIRPGGDSLWRYSRCWWHYCCGGWLWWQTVVLPPFSSVSAFSSSFCFCFSVSPSFSDGGCLTVVVWLLTVGWGCRWWRCNGCSSSLLLSFFFRSLIPFSSLFFPLGPLVFIGKNKGGESPTTPAQLCRRGRVAGAATVQLLQDCRRGVLPLFFTALW